MQQSHHDREAALTQGLTHLLARAVRGMAAPPVIRTSSFELIMEGLAMVQGDSPEVFEAVVGRNRHVAAVHDQLIAALSGLSDELRSTRRTGPPPA